MGVRSVSNYLKELIQEYEKDLLGNTYTFVLDNGEEIEFEIKKKNVPHLLGIGKLPLRQVKGKFAGELYSMLKRGQITLNHVISVPKHKEIYKKIMNFHYLADMLKSGDMVKIVKQIGSLKSEYLLYLDHRPDEIVHLGLAKDQADKWYPESLLVLKRDVTAYIENQLPVNIVEMRVTRREQQTSSE